MSSMWGNALQLSIFGESHGAAIGCVLDNLPSGIKLDLKLIQQDLLRRSAKSYELATPRKEDDDFEILSGYFNSRTTGTPLCAIIRNKDTRSRDYEPELIRPGHADYTAYKRYKGYQDFRGGGHFSGRITAALVLAGSISKQICRSIVPSIKFGSRIYSLGSVQDKKIEDFHIYENLDLSNYKYPLLDESLSESIETEIKKAILNDDSVGGILECWITGLPAGIGDPYFNSIESELSSLLFSVPAVKGVEFGSGFDLAYMKGSTANDAFFIDSHEVSTLTNHNGGINGGISNGMPIVYRVCIKPTPTIRKEQQTINLSLEENVTHSFKGRHDPCIVLRAPIVIESVSALAILNLLLNNINNKSWN